MESKHSNKMAQVIQKLVSRGKTHRRDREQIRGCLEKQTGSSKTNNRQNVNVNDQENRTKQKCASARGQGLKHIYVKLVCVRNQTKMATMSAHIKHILVGGVHRTGRSSVERSCDSFVKMQCKNVTRIVLTRWEQTRAKYQVSGQKRYTFTAHKPYH